MTTSAQLRSLHTAWERARAAHVARRPAVASRQYHALLRRLDRLELAEPALVPETGYLRVRVLLGEAGCVLELRGDAAASLEVLDRATAAAASLGRPDLEAALRGQRGLVLLRAGRTDEALADLDAGLAVRGETGDRVALHLNRGTLRVERGDLAGAVADYEAAVGLAAEQGDDVHQAMAGHNLGYAKYRQGNVPGALAAMDSAATLLPEDALTVTLLDKAQVLYEAGLVTDAADALDRARALLRRTRMVRDIADVELVQSRCLLDLRRYDEAAALARSAARRFGRLGNEPWRLRAETAELQARLGRDRAAGGPGRAVASRRAAAALTLAARGDAAGTVAGLGVSVPARLAAAEWSVMARDLDGARSVLGAVPDLARAPLALRVQREAVQAQLAFADGDRRAAVRAVRRGQRVLASHRSGLGSVDAVAASAVHGLRLATLDVSAALRSGRADAVFDAMERGRATFAGMGRVRPPADPELAELLARARGAMEAARLLGPSASGATLAERQRHQREARRLQELARARSWQVEGERRAPDPVTARRLRAALGERAAPGTVVANLTMVDGEVLAVRTDAAGSRLVRLAPLDAVADLVRRARADLVVVANELVPAPLRDVAGASLARTLDRLDAALLAPLAAAGDLHVAARDILLAVPWTALPSRAGRRTWVNSWVDLRTEGAAVRTGTVLSVAGPGLLGARAEAEAVAGVWGSATLLADDAATARETAARMDGADVVHLATHGTHEADSPLFSSLRLADGPLFAHELEGTDLQGAVVVLAACEVGLSTPRIGGEVLGLTSVLIRLGARAVVASVAPLRDDVSARVMPAFHAALRDGAMPGTALARAVAGEEGPVPLVCFGPLAL